MNILFGSDLHGSLKYTKMFFDKTKIYNPSKIVLLGDFYYNGARNDPPEEYCPKEVVKLVNSYADRLIAIKGNCESEVDQMVSDFAFCEVATLFIFNKVFYLTHGHHFNFDNLPKAGFDVFVQGHTHIGVLGKKEDKIFLNPGSVSLPKDGFHSYAILNDEGIQLRNLIDDTILKEIKF